MRCTGLAAGILGRMIKHASDAADASPPAPSVIPGRTGYVVARDGTRLFVRDWPVANPVGQLLVVHGLGEHGGRYAHVAAGLNRIGVSVRAHDHRGHGHSEGQRARLHRADDLLDDTSLVLNDFASTSDNAPFLLGHSMGGLIAARFAMEQRAPLRGLVLSSPALALHLSRLQRLAHVLAESLFADLAVPTGLRVDRLSHDRAVVDAYRSDPLVHGKITARLLRFMLTSIELVQGRAAELATPVLLMVSGDDALVDPAGSRRFHDALPAQSRTLAWYADAWHEAFNERPDIRSQALHDLTSWIGARIT
jgi:alpha-beta hydrolase superfamily lysophospholipase